MQPKASTDIRSTVREKYGAIATGASGCCGTAGLDALGYDAAQQHNVPEGADLGLGCGNPLAHAEPRSGETVLDLGSGAGIDVFLAAREVGPTGHVIGVDMTPAMLERARDNARKIGCTNAEFRLGEIEHLPVADASVDVIISNCVINLSPDKPRVFREALRVLRPGGRLVVSDLVLLEPLPEAIANSVDAYVGCVAGASLRSDYLQQIAAAGFENVEIVAENVYGCDDSELGRIAGDFVRSVKIRARRPAATRCCG